MRYNLKFAILVATQLTSVIAMERGRHFQQATLAGVAPMQAAVASTVNIGIPVTLDQNLDRTLVSLTAGPGGRYTIGARSIASTQTAIQKLRSNQELTDEEKSSFLICIAAMLKIEADPSLIIESAFNGYMSPSENQNVAFNTTIRAFQGFNGITLVSSVTFADLHAAYNIFKNRYVAQGAAAVATAQSAMQEISEFLQRQDAQLSPMMRQLVEIGRRNFQASGPLKAAYDRDVSTRGLDSGRFRQALDWVGATFGISEEHLINTLKNAFDRGQLQSPKPWSVQNIEDSYQHIAMPRRNAAAATPVFTIVEGVGVSGLHYSDFGKNAIVQFASQFNYLESPSTEVVNPSEYPGDRTQGPLGVIEAAAATYLRHVAVTTGRLPHALHNVLPESAPYQNGYFEPARDRDKANLARIIRQNLNKLEILPQWVVNEGSGTQQIHVLSAAPSYQGMATPNINSDEGQICTDIVAAQYEAIAKLAAIRSVLTGQSVNLHLTQVGQSAFNNPKEIMAEAFKRVAQAVKGFNVKVFVHIYINVDAFIQVNNANISGNIFRTSRMTKDQFFESAAQQVPSAPPVEDLVSGRRGQAAVAPAAVLADVPEAQTLAVGDAARDAYKTGINSFVRYYTDYYLRTIATFNQPPYSQEQVKIILDAQGLGGFFN